MFCAQWVGGFFVIINELSLPLHGSHVGPQICTVTSGFHVGPQIFMVIALDIPNSLLPPTKVNFINQQMADEPHFCTKSSLPCSNELPSSRSIIGRKRPRMCCSFYLYLPIILSVLTGYSSIVTTFVGSVVGAKYLM